MDRGSTDGLRWAPDFVSRSRSSLPEVIAGEKERLARSWEGARPLPQAVLTRARWHRSSADKSLLESQADGQDGAALRNTASGTVKQ